MINIESFKAMLKDERLHIGIGLIKKLYLADDRSYLKVSIDVLPEMREIIATMTWENTGPDSGDFEFPSTNDLVLFAQAEGDDDKCYIIRRLTSREDKIPEQAVGGDKVHRAKSGKKYWNISDSSILLSRGGETPTENIVLGQVFKKFAEDFLELLKNHATTDSTHNHIGNLGYNVSVPVQSEDYITAKTGYTNLKSSPISDSKILSDLVFTEK